VDFLIYRVLNLFLKIMKCVDFFRGIREPNKQFLRTCSKSVVKKDFEQVIG